MILIKPMSNPREQTIDRSFDYFRSLMNRYTDFVTLAGKHVRRAPPEKTEAIFREADEALQLRMIARLESEISIFEDMLGADETLENPARQLWRYFLKRKLVPCSDVLDKITSSDTVQVYGADLRLLFASLNFFDYISFTLEQIFSETWQSAVVRDPQYVQQLFADFTNIFSGEIRNTVKPATPAHLIEELETESLLKSDLIVKWMSPVFQNEKVDCIVAVVGITNL
jgi:hypothetical protein